MNVIQLGNSYICKPNATLSSNVNHQISFVSASLMHDVMKSAASHNVDFNQFRIMASCMVTLSRFMYCMKFKKLCEGDIFVNMLEQIKVSSHRLKKSISSFSLNLVNIL
jgi:lantibiotic modifying enzyme